MFESIDIIHTIKNRLVNEEEVFHFIQRGDHTDDQFRELVRCVNHYFYDARMFTEMDDVTFLEGYRGVIIHVRPHKEVDKTICQYL